MHHLVRFIVTADNAEEAKEKVETVVTKLVEWGEFDWYNDTVEHSRWKGCWTPRRLSTKRGQTMVQDAMYGQLTDFKRSLAAIRFMLDHYTDEQIFNEEFEQAIVEEHYLSRYQFDVAGGYHTNACWMFNEDGEGITSQKQLEWYLKDAAKLWVVQVDCHN